MPVIAGGVQAATGVAKLVTGAINNRKAKKEARELQRTRPKYEISDLAEQDLALAESELASGGMSPSARTAFNNLENQQFSSSLNAILKGGGSVNNVGNVFGSSQEGRQRLALLEDQMRINKINNLSRSRASMMQEQDKAFMFNQQAPWADRAQANAAARQQAQNDIWGGIGTAASAGMNIAGGIDNQNKYEAALGKFTSNQPQSSAPTASSFLPANFQQPTLPMQTITPYTPSVNFLEYQSFDSTRR